MKLTTTQRAKAIVQLKCPSCSKDDLFKTPTFSYKDPFAMQDECSNCGLKYEPEPGFYYGAMFISYILTGWFCLFFVGGALYFLDCSVNTAFMLLVAVCLLLFIYIFRLSRAIWLGMNVGYSTRADREP